ncbi:Cysteine--tRNA ligase [Candidatus Burarchaeum australiense]|nr:Cysteine--tRNA ligase [Candidatus Burarchaeum australiense]
MHNAFINVNSEKMSKSLGNFKTIRAVLKDHDAEAVRLFILSTHYRGPIDFTPEQLEQAANSLGGLRRTRELAEEAIAKGRTEGEPIKKQVKALAKTFEEAMDDDFTTPNALAALYELSTLMNNSLEKASAGELKYALSKYKKLAGALGFKLKRKKAAGRKIGAKLEEYVKTVTSDTAFIGKAEDELIDYVVKLRDEMRRQGKFAVSDQIRAKLGELGVTIEDTPQGAKWRRQ